MRRSGSDGERWVPLLEVLNASFCAEMALEPHRQRILDYLASAQPSPSAEPDFSGDPAGDARVEAPVEATVETSVEAPGEASGGATCGATPDPEDDGREVVVAFDNGPAAAAEPQAVPEAEARPLPWGTRAAKAAEIERIRREIEKKRQSNG